MSRFVHTCIRVRDPEASERFYQELGFERRGRLNFETAYNLYMGLPGGGDTLELTVNRDRDQPYELGDGYNHWRSSSTTSTPRCRRSRARESNQSERRTRPAGARTSAASASCATRTATGSS